jgi:hypothetical protein
MKYMHGKMLALYNVPTPVSVGYILPLQLNAMEEYHHKLQEFS